MRKLHRTYSGMNIFDAVRSCLKESNLLQNFYGVGVVNIQNKLPTNALNGISSPLDEIEFADQDSENLVRSTSREDEN